MFIGMRFDDKVNNLVAKLLTTIESNDYGSKKQIDEETWETVKSFSYPENTQSVYIQKCLDAINNGVGTHVLNSLRRRGLDGDYSVSCLMSVKEFIEHNEKRFNADDVYLIACVDDKVFNLTTDDGVKDCLKCVDDKIKALAENADDDLEC